MGKKKSAKKRVKKKVARSSDGAAKKEKVKTTTGVTKARVPFVTELMMTLGATSVQSWQETGKKTYTVRAVFPG